MITEIKDNNGNIKSYSSNYNGIESTYEIKKYGKYAKKLAELYENDGINRYNYYIEHDNYIEIILYDNPRNKYFSCLIDTNDYFNIDVIPGRKINECFWRPVKSNNKNIDTYYVCCKILYTVYKMHQVITSKQNNLVPDHKNNNTFDNRKCNLRMVTNRQNCLNRSLQSNNTTGFPGIAKDESNKDTGNYSYKVRWVDKNTGKNKSKRFTISKYPDEETALLEAAYFREQMEIENDYQNQRYIAEQKIYNQLYKILKLK